MSKSKQKQEKQKQEPAVLDDPCDQAVYVPTPLRIPTVFKKATPLPDAPDALLPRNARQSAASSQDDSSAAILERRAALYATHLEAELATAIQAASTWELRYNDAIASGEGCSQETKQERVKEAGLKFAAEMKQELAELSSREVKLTEELGKAIQVGERSRKRPFSG